MTDLCDLDNKNSTGPRVVCYWNTSEVKDGKLKIHYERQNK